MKKQGKMKTMVTEGLSLPRDLLLGECIIHIYGNSELYIENYSGIIEYNEDKIKIKSKKMTIQIEGKELFICYYTDEEMKITGIIANILYNI